MRWVTVLLLVIMLGAPAAAQTPAPAPAVESVDRTVVLVSVLTESGGRLIRGSGSGIIVEPDGLILTANHVVTRARQIEVTLWTGETLRARVVGADPVFDNALIKVDSRLPLPTAVLGASSSLVTGSVVTALGRSPRRRNGPTTGVVIETDIEARPGIPHIRASAVVWPGDSGGALVNDRGEVVGLIVAITRDGTVSLSVASDAIRQDFAELRAGFVRHPWLGVTGTTITTDLARELGLAVGSGVLIYEVVEGGPAALAGVHGGRAAGPRDIPRGGDVIVAIDGRPVPTFGALAGYVLGRRIGDTVTLELLREGQPFTTSIVLGERPGI